VDLVSPRPRFGPLRLDRPHGSQPATGAETTVPMHFRPRA
jgi:hypothetical protein